jgi:hypothetical protein
MTAPSIQRFRDRESKSSSTPNGHFSHPIRAQVVIAGSIGGNNTALWEVPTTLIKLAQQFAEPQNEKKEDDF